MGIRMLHRRTARAQAQEPAPARAEAAPSASLPTVPPAASGASTARIPADRARALARAAAGLGRRLAGRGRTAVRLPDAAAWRAWADVGLGYVALVLARLPKPRPDRRFTVFVATTAPAAGPTVGGRRDGSARPRR
ncbi:MULTISPECIES: hypothetical protein [unclassified Streptomyces]|uniref:hypothetical protein n=1 Tax=unclassified Streptomyces TaxID=2593676 RepID=UPI001F0447E2|nr:MULTISPECIES: hypothetical protein [unclassified Streptomyces]MCH0562745.1 hypothetical protein [Streptomyces sp. MUM 2J]MCH0567744.1 hypothetical protein [Streptomyces sp. MUM 136J]